MVENKAEITDIKERNARVEADKAWEVSHVRRGLIVVFTYILATIWMFYLGIDKPYLASLVPTVGYFLSTLSLNFAKKLWLENLYKSSNK